MALAFRVAGAQRHPPLLPRGSDERRGRERRMRAHGEAGRRRVRHRGAGLHAEPDPRRRALRRAVRASSPRARTSTRCTSRIPAGCCRRSAPHADPGDQRRSIGGEAARAARPLHDRSRRAHVHGCAALRRERAAMRIRRGRGWHFESALRARGRQPARARSHRAHRRRGAGRSRSNYFTRLAEAEGSPSGRPQAFDAAYLHHQLPGGMVGTMRRHLAEARVVASREPR